MRSIRRTERQIGVVALAMITLIALALFFLLPPVPSAPIWAGAGEVAPHHGGTFVFFHESDVHGFDPHVSYDELSGMGEKLLFEGLIDYDHDVHFVPRLARELPTVSEDGLTYTFRLREGAHFHNGREIVAEDVRWSMEHLLAPSTHSPGLAFYALIDAREACARLRIDDVQLTERLLADAKVALIPGGPFAIPGFIRLSYAASMKEIEEGVRRIAAYLS